MTKWGMPGVYTHAFMDGWSPGYLGSVAYNHNGMMRMYETQSGVDAADSAATTAAANTGRAGRAGGADTAAAAAGRGGRGQGAAGRAGRAGGTAADAAATGRAGGEGAGGPPGTAPSGRGNGGVPTGRGGGQPREWYRGIPIPPNAVATFSRRNNTNYMQTGVLSALQLTSMFPNLVLAELLHQDEELDGGRPDEGAVRRTSFRCSAT